MAYYVITFLAGLCLYSFRGKSKGVFRVYTNILATFIIGGLWHGAGWTFVFWGLLHGLALVIYSIWHKTGYVLPKVLAWFITFNFVNIAWFFFRAKDWQHALIVLEGMAGLSGIVIPESREQLLSFLSSFEFISFAEVTQYIGGGSSVLNFIITGFLITLLLNNSMEISNIISCSGKFRFKYNFKWALVFSVCVFVSFLFLFFGHTSSSEFLYFNF